jgi:hypothetical protein
MEQRLTRNSRTTLQILFFSGRPTQEGNLVPQPVSSLVSTNSLFYCPFDQAVESLTCSGITLLSILTTTLSVSDSLSSAPSSVLNIGLNDQIVSAIITLTGNKLFALDLYRRFLHQFGLTVLRIRPSVYVGIEHQVMREDHVSDIASLSEEGMERLVRSFKEVTDVPPDGSQQLLMTIDAIYDWWVRHHPEETSLSYGMSGVAFIVQEMVYGNMRIERDQEGQGQQQQEGGGKSDGKRSRPASGVSRTSSRPNSAVSRASTHPLSSSSCGGSGVVYCTPFTRGFFGPDRNGDEILKEGRINELEVLEVSDLDLLSYPSPYSLSLTITAFARDGTRDLSPDPRVCGRDQERDLATRRGNKDRHRLHHSKWNRLRLRGKTHLS